MQEPNPMRHFDKITRVYSERREQQVAIRIQYDIVVESGCKIIALRDMQELGR
jgi:hypothetical protein